MVWNNDRSPGIGYFVMLQMILMAQEHYDSNIIDLCFPDISTYYHDILEINEGREVEVEVGSLFPVRQSHGVSPN